MNAEGDSVEAVLAAVGRRVAAAGRLAPRHDDELLTAVAMAVVTALEAQAASIALYDAATDRLVFRAAAGPAAGGIVGMAIEPEVGIAGYVFTTGQPLAVADVAADPRFERSVAEATGHVPSTLLAVPLSDETGTVGVLEALDKDGGTFSLRDLDIATAMGSVATLAVRDGRLRQDAGAILARVLSDLLAEPAESTGEPADPAAIDALVARASVGLADDDDPTWAIADRIARLGDIDVDAKYLAIDWLDALIRHGDRADGGRGRRSGRP
ncbi:MAG TPA: GAF domain-containing protein [Desertimonas sp.]|nr:GAF domain-containing protein [Desertimonas sp.]